MSWLTKWFGRVAQPVRPDAPQAAGQVRMTLNERMAFRREMVFESVRDALLLVSDNEGIGISRRRITLSTSGVVPNIARTGDEIGVMLAISLHAVRDELRNELVPLNRKYPIAQLLDACRNYPGVSNARRDIASKKPANVSTVSF